MLFLDYKLRVRPRKRGGDNLESQKVTLNDVAKKAGVGKGTVDRVIHNRGRFSEETRKRVMDVIEELGYKPNRVAVMLAKKKEYKIAVIYHDREKDFWDDVAAGIRGAEEEFAPLGVNLERFILPKVEPDMQAEILEKIISGEEYAGIALVPYKTERIFELLDKAVQKGIRVITFNNDEPCSKGCFVGQELYKSGTVAGRLMSHIAPKNARIMVIRPKVVEMAGLNQRVIGFLDIIKGRKDINQVEVVGLPQDNELVYQETMRIVKEKRPDAIYVSTIYVEQVADAMEKLGIGKDIILIGHDLSKSIVRHLTQTQIIAFTIGQDPYYQGYKTIELLSKWIVLGEEPEQGNYYTKNEIFVKENCE